MQKILIIIILVDSVLLIASILLQQKGTGLSGVFGGASTSYLTRRGAEKFLVIFTVISAAIFVITALLMLFLK